MKNLLILYLLIISPHLLAQNSAMVFSKTGYSYSNPSLLESYKISVSQLTPVDQNLHKKAKNLLLAKNLIPLDGFDSDNFSSLILKEQLTKLILNFPE